MNILSINLFYKEGSTGKIVYEIHKGLLMNGHHSHVCYGLGKHDEPNVRKYSSEFFSKFYTYLAALTGLQYVFAYRETNRLINQINSIRPDIVHLHVVNCNTANIYRLLDFLKVNKYKTVLTFHAELFYTGGCSHAFDCMRWKTGCGRCPQLWSGVHSLVFDFTHFFWRKFRSIYFGFDSHLKIVCVSNWLKMRAELSPFFSKINISVIENGIDTANIYYPKLHTSIRFKYNLDAKKIILHVTPSFRSKIKGGKSVIELAERLDKEKYCIIIVGYDDNLELPVNVITVDKITNQDELTEYYSAADLTLLTSKVETYSMVCVESLSCGTPVVGFRCGAPEEISLKEYSYFVENGNIDELENAIYAWENKKNELSPIISDVAKNYYSTQRMTDKYIQIYKDFL